MPGGDEAGSFGVVAPPRAPPGSPPPNTLAPPWDPSSIPGGPWGAQPSGVPALPALDSTRSFPSDPSDPDPDADTLCSFGLIAFLRPVTPGHGEALLHLFHPFRRHVTRRGGHCIICLVARPLRAAGGDLCQPAMRRVAVVGCGGSGKSWLSRELGRLLDLPVIHLDAHYWRPGWVEPPHAEWEAVQSRLVAGDAWVMDGNYHSTLHLRTARADTVLFLDRSRWACLWGVLSRWARLRGTEHAAPGCRERLNVPFLRWIWHFPRRTRPILLSACDAFESVGGRVIVLRTRRTAAEYLASVRRARTRALCRAIGAQEQKPLA